MRIKYIIPKRFQLSAWANQKVFLPVKDKDITNEWVIKYQIFLETYIIFCQSYQSILITLHVIIKYLQLFTVVIDVIEACTYWLIVWLYGV